MPVLICTDTFSFPACESTAFRRRRLAHAAMFLRVRCPKPYITASGCTPGSIATTSFPPNSSTHHIPVSRARGRALRCGGLWHALSTRGPSARRFCSRRRQLSIRLVKYPGRDVTQRVLFTHSLLLAKTKRVCNVNKTPTSAHIT